MSDIAKKKLLARIEARTARVVVVGQGYVGLPLAMQASEAGMSVVGYEVSPERLEMLREGTSYVEDVPSEQIAAALDRGYTPTADPRQCKGFEVAIVTVPTPLREGLPDLSYIEDAARDLATQLRPGALVVLESTTYPGTTEEYFGPVLESSGLRAGIDFFLGYSPERIDPGNQVWTLETTPKVVSGVDEASLSCVEAFYSTIVQKTVPVASPKEAELVKLLENTFRHVNIALINELAVFAHDLGIDVWNAIDAASTKPFGFMRFTPGPGVGGHCLPVDPAYLAWRVKRSLGHQFRFVELANDVNDHMPDYVVSRVIGMLNEHEKSVKGSRILLLGLTYKAGTSDWRESPSIDVARKLAGLGADLRGYDPHLPPGADLGVELDLVDCNAEQLADADLVVVLVDHPDLPLDDVCDHARYVFDTKGCLRDRAFSGEVI